LNRKLLLEWHSHGVLLLDILWNFRISHAAGLAFALGSFVRYFMEPPGSVYINLDTTALEQYTQEHVT